MIHQRFQRQLKKLQKGIADAGYDRHRLRILVKRARYMNGAFPGVSPLSDKAANALKKRTNGIGCLARPLPMRFKRGQKKWI